MIIETISLAVAAGSTIAVSAAFIQNRRLRYDLLIEMKTSAALDRIVKSHAATIELQRAEIDKWARTRSAIAKAGGLARGMQQRKIAEQKANAARAVRDATIGTLMTTPLRPRAEVVAGVAEQRAAKKSSGAVAP